MKWITWQPLILERNLVYYYYYLPTPTWTPTRLAQVHVPASPKGKKKLTRLATCIIQKSEF